MYRGVRRTYSNWFLMRSYLCQSDAVLFGGHVFVPHVVVGFHDDLLLARLDGQDLILEGCEVKNLQIKVGLRSAENVFPSYPLWSSAAVRTSLLSTGCRAKLLKGPRDPQ